MSDWRHDRLTGLPAVTRARGLPLTDEHVVGQNQSVFITNHVLAGALLGNLLPPVPAVGVGFVSHLVMDNLPHYGKGGPLHLPTARKDGLLGLVGIAFCTALTPPSRRGNVLAGILGACLPDTDKLGEHLLGNSPWPVGFDRFHKRIQREAPNRFPIEVLTATGLALLASRQLRR